MKTYLCRFLHRGLIFGGFGPVVMGIVYEILSLTLEGFSLSGSEVFLGILSTYLLAFVHAGASVFMQIEHWSVARATFCHLGILYLAYTLCYILNRWLPFEPLVLLIFTAFFVAGYFVICGIVWLCIRATGKQLNRRLMENQSK